MSSSVSVTAVELSRGFPFSQCVAHCNAVFLSPKQSRPRTSTRWPFPHLDPSLSLAPSSQFRTETTSLLTTILWLIVDSTHSSASVDVTLSSSMMFSSLFAGSWQDTRATERNKQRTLLPKSATNSGGVCSWEWDAFIGCPSLILLGTLFQLLSTMSLWKKLLMLPIYPVCRFGSPENQGVVADDCGQPHCVDESLTCPKCHWGSSVQSYVVGCEPCLIDEIRLPPFAEMSAPAKTNCCLCDSRFLMIPEDTCQVQCKRGKL